MKHEDNENEVERASKKIFKDEPFMGIQDEYFDKPKMVKVKSLFVIAERLRGAEGQLISEKEVRPPAGKPYTMWTVQLNTPIYLSSCLTKNVYMTSDCFEVLND